MSGLALATGGGSRSIPASSAVGRSLPKWFNPSSTSIACCHGKEKTEKGLDLTAAPVNGFTRSYWSLCGDPAGKASDAALAPLVPRFIQRNQIQTTPPGGQYGALGSRLMSLLRSGHENVQLNDGELRRLAAWIDCNAVFYGTFDPAEQAKQVSGTPIEMPPIQ
jgi:hypothetical protein